jgi:hypothetical protein
MIRIYESFEDDRELNKDKLDTIIKNNGFKKVMSSDEYVYNYNKTEIMLNNITVTLTVYYEDVSKKYSIGVTTPELPDYSYLSDYISSVTGLTQWFNSDYRTIIGEMKKQLQ